MRMPETVEDCLFCKIVRREVPAHEVLRDERTVAFRDINPQAPTHILLIPTTHYANAGEQAAGDPQGLASLFVAAAALAESEGIAQSGYRLVTNTGSGAGQSVFHIHVHLLGGRRLTWPPG
jgi:histidine triad (HIT) family protein